MNSKRITINKLVEYVLDLSGSNVTINLDPIFNTPMVEEEDEYISNLMQNKKENISNFPSKLKKIFDPFIKECNRVGSLKVENENLSFYYSILYSLIEKFRNSNINVEEQISIIKKFRDKLIIHISENANIVNDLVKYKVTRNIIKTVADYFDINIFILNIHEDKIFIISNETEYDLFRNSIFLVYYNLQFECMNYNNNYIHDYNSIIIKKLVNVDKNLINLVNNQDINLPFICGLSDLELLSSIKTQNVQPVQSVQIEIILDNISRDGEQADILKNTQDNVDNVNKLIIKVPHKAKLSELQEIAEKLNISIDKEVNNKKKKKTINELLSEINEKNQ